MDLSVAALVATKQLAIQTQATTLVLRKVLDMQEVQAQSLADIVAQAGGVGQNLNLLG